MVNGRDTHILMIEESVVTTKEVGWLDEDLRRLSIRDREHEC